MEKILLLFQKSGNSYAYIKKMIYICDQLINKYRDFLYTQITQSINY